MLLSLTPPLLALALLWGFALWLFREQQAQRWNWGAVELPESARTRRTVLVLVSFASLFFELLVIRWLSVEVRVFAYFKNLALIACFLGFGVGVYLARRKVQLLYAPAVLVLLALVLRFPWEEKNHLLHSLPQFISGSEDLLLWATTAPGSGGWETRTVQLLVGLFIVTILFSLAALLFVPFGQVIGHALSRDPNVNLAYSLNVAASVLGIAAFTGLSALSLPPEVWFALGLVTLLPLWWQNKRALSVAAALSLAVIGAVREYSLPSAVIWSPYQKVRLKETRWDDGRPVAWNLEVNNTGYQSMSDHSSAFLARHPGLLQSQPERFLGYNLPFRFRPGATRVLVVGAGLGNDAAGALRNTQAEIVAVEIDPVIYRLGRQLHPERPYDSPGVRMIINDARNFFQTTKERFDLVIFGLLDAHTLGTPYTNVRLDNYVYTRESIDRAASLLAPGGVLVIKFEVARDFIGERLASTLSEVFGREPLCFYVPHGWSTGATFFVADRGGTLAAVLAADPELNTFVESRRRHYEPGRVEPAADDWPYFYHRQRTIPNVYLLLSLILFLLTVLFLRRQAAVPAQFELHFFFLGLAFLLLEVQVISRMALFFGATWQVNSLVIAAVLVMILLANLVASFWPGVRRIAYPALLVSLLLTYLVPQERLFLGVFWLEGLVVSLLFTLPIFFAGLIFISSFQRARSREVAFGSNLVGSVAGGLLECTSFVLGLGALLLVALAAYAASWAMLRKPALVPAVERG